MAIVSFPVLCEAMVNHQPAKSNVCMSTPPVSGGWQGIAAVVDSHSLGPPHCCAPTAVRLWKFATTASPTMAWYHWVPSCMPVTPLRDSGTGALHDAPLASVALDTQAWASAFVADSRW